MYMNSSGQEFGAWPVSAGQSSSRVRFSLFFPNSTQYQAHPGRSHYGDTQIQAIWITGTFQSQLGQKDWSKAPANAMRKSLHPSGKGDCWEWTTPAALAEGFYQYRYIVQFCDGTERQLADPCARWGGETADASGLVVGKSPVETVRPLKSGRKPYRDLVVYELSIDDFTAEIPGPEPALSKLLGKVAYLTQELGVNAILFMPWTAWATDDYNWGYAPVGYFAIEHRYTYNYANKAEEIVQRSRLKQLISELHDRDVHVIMDGVFNHAGPDCSSARGFVYRHFYLDQNDCPFIGQFGESFDGLLDLDYANACTQELIQDVCFYWMDEFGIDGIRYDFAKGYFIGESKAGLPTLMDSVAAHAAKLDSSNGTRFSQTIEFLDERAASVVSQTAATSYWRESLHQNCFDYLWDGSIQSQIMNSLDSKAWLTPAEKVATTYLTNHDHSNVAWQAGARTNEGSVRWYRTQPYAMALLLGPGTPMLANGQEFAADQWIMNDDHGSSRRVVARPLHWGFATDTFGEILLPLYRRLIALRLQWPGLRSDNIYPAAWPSWATRFDPKGYGIDTSRQLMIFHRWGTGASGQTEYFIIALNFTDSDQWVDIPFPLNGTWVDEIPQPRQQVQVNAYWLRNWRVPSNYGCVFRKA